MTTNTSQEEVVTRAQDPAARDGGRVDISHFNMASRVDQTGPRLGLEDNLAPYYDDSTAYLNCRYLEGAANF